ncbi:MAG TPA: 6-phosphogluconolactonase [Polyangiaceae bacterium]|jgi:6-phosphogluconolactonase
MTTKVVPGQLVASRDPAQVAREAATRIARVLRGAVGKSGRAAIALSGGNTPRDAYGLLARESGIDWTKVNVFWVDERAVPPTDDRSNYRWAKSTLLDPAGIRPERVHRMAADAPDRDGAARDYEKAIRQEVELDGDGIPAFDALVLGVGDDGHTASLFPGESTVDIHDRLVAAVEASGSREARLTLTPPAIEHARHLFILAVGAAKRPPLERVWAAQGNVHETPARVVRGCRGAVTWLIDKAAGGLAD